MDVETYGRKRKRGLDVSDEHPPAPPLGTARAEPVGSSQRQTPVGTAARAPASTEPPNSSSSSSSSSSDSDSDSSSDDAPAAAAPPDTAAAAVPNSDPIPKSNLPPAGEAIPPGPDTTVHRGDATSQTVVPRPATRTRSRTPRGKASSSHVAVDSNYFTAFHQYFRQNPSVQRDMYKFTNHTPKSLIPSKLSHQEWQSIFLKSPQK